MPEYIVRAEQVRPTADTVLKDTAIHIRDGLIAEVGPAQQVIDQAGDVQVRDFPGATVVPGLIDALAFLCLDAGPDASTRFGTRQDAQFEQIDNRLAALVRAGVTTVRDVGTPGALISRIRQLGEKEQGRPRVLSSGAPITRPHGEAAFFGGGLHGAPKDAVGRRLDEGADLVHVIGSGGHLTPGGPPDWEAQYSAAELTEAVTAAHDAGVRVVVSAHGAEAIAAAVDAGADEIDYLTWTVGPGKIAFDEAVAKRMASEGIGGCIPHSMNWRRVVAGMGTARATEYVYGKIPWLQELGVPLIGGSRAGTSNAPFSDPIAPLEAACWSGLTNEQALEASTATAARILGLDDLTGRIATGLSADLVISDGDPVTDGPEVLRKLQGTVAAGAFV